MGKLLDGVRRYFETATQDEIRKNWEELKEYNEVGPVAHEYIEYVYKIIRKNNKDVYKRQEGNV